MTIAQAFNEITIAQGGTPSTGGTITGAIDALNDTLAGSDQKPAQTIEGAIRLLGAHIGGGVAPSGTISITENGEGIDVAQYAYADVNVSGGGGSEYNIKCYKAGATPSDPFVELVDPCAYIGEWDAQSGHFIPSGEPVTKAKGGDIIVIQQQGHADVDGIFAVLSSPNFATAEKYMLANQPTSQCPMPAADACFVVFPTL